MKLMFLFLTVLPLFVSATEIDEEFFHECINEEILFSGVKRYNLLKKYDQDSLTSNDIDIIILQVWYEAGYEKGLLKSEEIFEDSRLD